MKVITKVYNVDVRQIALMTPYKAQKECLKKLAEEAGFSGIAVATITESQGNNQQSINFCNVTFGLA